MAKKTNKQLLNEIMGLTFINSNNGKTYKMLSFKATSDGYTIVTDKEWLSKEESEMPLFFESLLPVAEEEQIQQTSVVINNKTEQASAMFGTLTGILLDNIKKVQEDSNYIPKAREIKASVDSIINATRLQLDIIKEEKKKLN